MSPASLDYAARESQARRRRQLIGFGALLLLAVMVAALVGSTVRQANVRQLAEQQQVRTQAILLATSRLQLSIHAAGRSVRGYMITDEERSLALYERARRDSARLIEQLGALADGNPAERREVAAIARNLTNTFAMGDRLVALQRSGWHAQAIAPLRSGRAEQRMSALLGQIDQLANSEIAAEQRHAAAVRAADHRQEMLTYLLAGVAVIFLGATAAVGIGASRAHSRAVSLSARLHHMATHDDLTGLFNRRSFFERLQRERDISARTGRPLAVAIIDVDHFKRINDSHGHQGGDQVLVHVAGLLSRTLRASDIVGRIGGEEFAVIMPETGIAEAQVACERLRRSIQQSAVALPSGVRAMATISTGVALLGEAEDRDTLMGRADHALYAAKSAGRNQVRMAA